MNVLSKNSYDAIIIGAGHNGLVCSCYLAAAGLKVLLLEKRSVVGGAAVTEEFHPGFRNSIASYTVSLLNPKVINDLNLHQHGLEIINRPQPNFLPLSDTEYLMPGSNLAETQAEFRRFSVKDAEILPQYYEMLESVADVLRSFLLTTPMSTRNGLSGIFEAIKSANYLRKLEDKIHHQILDMFTKSAAQILDGWFENDHIKALFGFDSIVGNYASPWTPGSGYVLLHHVFGEVNGIKGAWGHAVGGMGSITQAMAKEAVSLGVTIKTDSSVAKIAVEEGRATGVLLESGELLNSRAVIGNLNPKLMYLNMFDESVLDAEFLNRMKNYQCGSATFRMNVALSELPNFTCKPGTDVQLHHQSGIIIAPTMKYMEQAYFDAKQLGWSKQPIVEMLIPSTVDSTLSPAGQHVASLFCQHFDPNLPNGKDWSEFREAAADTIIDTVNKVAPNFKQSVIAKMILSPQDLENKLSLVGGDIMHGTLGLDQLYAARPLLGYGQYRGPLKGLYMCGAGTHPGGGVTGVPGHNAAAEIIKDFSFPSKN